ncbi:hypothetical protein F8388_001326 [Cannabis sativa]|uniref:DUF4283 domain-containing protein n=1 Tax=Cannabis sativa TaxID=3483 RepID=A0A7J6EK17_CANSA|nr:hypothetical protein F8388_001326 [Cannabis sativa]KAF4358050.1 hypothetical protein G4B88_009613 [Cannabis sativa]
MSRRFSWWVSFHLGFIYSYPLLFAFMESIITCKSPQKGKSFSCIETTVKLSPCASSVKALTSCCLYGKVIAPMNVDEATILDFVAKTWKKQISVVPMVDVMKTANLFKFGFETADGRNWALVNGPWCIHGYTLVLQAWSPSVDGTITLNVLRVWIQIHNQPHEYFSRENGYLLGGLVGKVVKLDLEDDKPATWTNFLKILVDIDVQKPLVSGCFFDLISGEKQWLQVKYVKIGIFVTNVAVSVINVGAVSYRLRLRWRRMMASHSPCSALGSPRPWLITTYSLDLRMVVLVLQRPQAWSNMEVRAHR